MTFKKSHMTRNKNVRFWITEQKTWMYLPIYISKYH